MYTIRLRLYKIKNIFIKSNAAWLIEFNINKIRKLFTQILSKYKNKTLSHTHNNMT